jgi:hypothetical protein
VEAAGKKRPVRRKVGGFTVYNYCIVNNESLSATVPLAAGGAGKGRNAGL